MNRIGYATIALFLVPTISCPAGELGSFQFIKSIERDVSQEEEILAVTLDSDIYAATKHRFADLRIVDTEADVIPCKVQQETKNYVKQVRQPSSGTIKSLTERDDNSIEIVVQISDKTPRTEGVIFHTPLKNFERQVSVFGSNDGTKWQPLTNDGVIFDYTRYMDVSNNEIKLPTNEFRLFKAVIKEVVDQRESPLMKLTRQFKGDKASERTEQTMVERRPLRINRISFWHTVTRTQFQRETLADYPIIEFHTEELPEEKQTIIHVRTRREPLTRFTLETSSVNFSRHLTVQEPIVRGVTTTWEKIGSATVSAFGFRNFKKEQLRVSFSEQRHQEYRIVIDNQDNAPLVITGVQAQGHAYRALFFAEASGKYQVYYNSESAEAPTYDTVALEAVLGKKFQPAAATLGPQVKNPTFNAHSGLQIKTLLDNPVFLGSVIGLMVLVLGFLLFRASRRIAD